MNKFFAPLAIALALSGCDATETGNPGGKLRLAIGATTHDPNVADVRGGQVAVDEAWVSQQAVVFVACGDASENVTFEPGALDLAAPQSSTTQPSSAREYCAVAGGLVLAPGSAGPDRAGRSMLIRGTRADGVRFTIASAAVPTFNLTTTPPTQNFALGAAVLGFDLATWFESTDLNGALPDTSGEIFVDASSNADVLLTFESTVVPSLGVYADLDEDGSIDGSEATPIATQR